MIFVDTPLNGAFVIEPEIIEDERGFFARTFSAEEFSSRGMNPRLVQCSVSYNKRKETLRGIHYQIPPRAEAKLVRCTRGAVYDVIIDLRPGSASYCKWFAVELTADNHKMFYIPEGFAHGLQTLEDDTEVFYQMSEVYAPELARGVRWNDPVFGITWPLEVTVISERDRDYPDFEG